MNTIDEYERRYQATLDALRLEAGGSPTQTPGRALELGDGVSRRDATRAAVMRIRRGTYPYRLTPIGRRKVVLVADIALALVGPAPQPNADAAADTQHVPPTKRGPGRPRKARPAEDSVVAGGVS